MIAKLLKIQNVGLLRDATETGAIGLSKVTMVYADNGRGKSTFGALLRDWQLGDGARVMARRTIDTKDDPHIGLLLSDGQKAVFESGAWKGDRRMLEIFDSEFVEGNVYSGFEVRPDQRQSLLGFALGDQAVALKQLIDSLTQQIDVQAKARSQAEKVLAASSAPYNVGEFVALAQVPDIVDRITAQEKRMEAAKNAKQLGSRQMPTSLEVIHIDLGEVFALLSTELKELEARAEELVKDHLAAIGGEGAEEWISEGQQYVTGPKCPFCGQGAAELALIAAYKSYFNEAYGALKEDVANLRARIQELTGPEVSQSAAATASTNEARTTAWKDQLSLDAPVLDAAALQARLMKLREALSGLLDAKAASPISPIGSAVEMTTTQALLDEVNQVLLAYNQECVAVITAIAEMKTALASDDPEALRAELDRMRATRKRFLPEVALVVGEFQQAEASKKALEEKKATARTAVDDLMAKTLQTYEARINELIQVFGGEFAIAQLKPSYLGSGEPRTDYGLKLRGKAVKLGSRADLTKGPGFATTLSEADKRTLAFAFFFARVEVDPDLAKKIIVLDDPVSSLDRNRRYQTVRRIAALSGKCVQTIVLSHDSYFLRELRNSVADLDNAVPQPKVLKLRRTKLGYSAFDDCDLDEMCASPYYQHHSVVAKYVDGQSTASPQDVAKAIRPLLEGYYHRKFPGRLPKRLMFGQILAEASRAAPDDPLSNLKPSLKELGEINEYVGQFHHDADQGDQGISAIVDSELLGVARRALNLIYASG